MSTEQSILGRWGPLDGPIFQFVIAKVVQYEPKAVTSLLQVNSAFYSATARALYDEVYIQDQDDALRFTPSNSRLQTILDNTERYAKLVRTLVLVPKQDDGRANNTQDMMNDAIQPERLGQMLKIFPRLEAFVWASNRMPFRSISSVVYNACPNIAELVIRPTNSDLAHSFTRLTTQEGAIATNLQRWDGFMLQSLSNLRTLSISGLSQEGIRELEKLLPQAKRLQHLCVDSQFIDDLLLFQIAHIKQLRTLLIKSSGTKMTDKGILAIIENSDTLQNLTLTEVEGRLNKAFWTKIACLPPSLRCLRVAFNEDNPHHSWVSDHLSTIFETLEMAPDGLQTFAVTRLTPRGDVVPVNWNSQEGMVLKNGNGDLEQGMMLKRVFHHSCDDVVSPRDFPEGSIARIIDFGRKLQRLELDFFTMDLDDLRKIVESCNKLEYLRVLVDSPLPKILGLSSSFVTLTSLHTFVLGITEAHAPQQSLICQPRGKGKSVPSSTPSSPIAKRTATPMSPIHSEPDSISPSSTPRTPLLGTHRRSLSSSAGIALQNFAMNVSNSGLEDLSAAGLQGPRGSVGTFDTSVPPKREIRKFARRCPSLRIIRWIGRNGKGEWRIAAGTSSIHTHIEFTPIHLVIDEEAEQLTLVTGADVEKFIIEKRSANLPYPGKRLEEVDTLAAASGGGDGKTGEMKTPRIDGRQFPRLKVTASTSAKTGETSAATPQGDDSKRKKSISAEQKPPLMKNSSADTALQATIRPNAGISSGSQKVKTYAAASDPKSPITAEDIKKKSETKMTVLGESNGKKAQVKATADTTKVHSKARAESRSKGPDETPGIQSRAPSLTSGAAGRRKRNQAAAIAAAQARGPGQGSGETSPTSKRADRRNSKFTRA